MESINAKFKQYAKQCTYIILLFYALHLACKLDIFPNIVEVPSKQTANTDDQNVL